MPCLPQITSSPSPLSLLISHKGHSSRIRPVHRRNFPRYRGPFQLSPERLAAPLLEHFVPFEQLVGEAEVRLNDDVEAAGADVAAAEGGEHGGEGVRREAGKSLLCAWEGEVQRGHDFGNADGGGAGDTDAAVD